MAPPCYEVHHGAMSSRSHTQHIIPLPHQHQTIIYVSNLADSAAWSSFLTVVTCLLCIYTCLRSCFQILFFTEQLPQRGLGGKGGFTNKSAETALLWKDKQWWPSVVFWWSDKNIARCLEHDSSSTKCKQNKNKSLPAHCLQRFEQRSNCWGEHSKMHGDSEWWLGTINVPPDLLAQWLERGSYDPIVRGSIPAGSIFFASKQGSDHAASQSWTAFGWEHHWILGDSQKLLKLWLLSWLPLHFLPQGELFICLGDGGQKASCT